MRHRPVIGGVFIKMLEDPSTWKKWASRDRFKPGRVRPRAGPAAGHRAGAAPRDRSAPWRYTVARPSEGWTRPDFDDSRWRRGPAGFGTRGTPGIRVATTWNTPDIWIRREITLPPSTDPSRVQLWLYHDEDVEVYIDGILAARETGYVTTHQPVEISGAARERLKPGAKVVVAVHCHQTGGGQGVDVGLVDVDERQP